MFSLPHPDLLAIVQRNSLPDQPVYLVGGCVRDALIGQEIHDLDFCTASGALELGRRVGDALQAAYYPMDLERGISRVILEHPNRRLIMDFADFQAEDLEGDLRGRDFTINAIALKLDQPDSLIDPLNGVSDLAQKILRPCSPTALQDDPVRILRGIRLALNFGFRLLPATRQAMKQAAPYLPKTSAERLRDEIFRLLATPQPAAAIRSLELLGCLPYLFPELLTLKGVTQSPPHTTDVWEHTVGVMTQLSKLIALLAPSPDPEAAENWAAGLVSFRLGRYRQPLAGHLAECFTPDLPRRALLFLAALYHDSGKPQTRTIDAEGRIRFFEHEQASVRIVRQRAHALHLSNQEIDYLATVVGHHLRPILLAQSETAPSRRAIYRFFRQTGSAGVDIGLHALADTLATYGPTLPHEVWITQLDTVRILWEAWWEHPAEQVRPKPLLTGRDLMDEFGLAPGPQIGALLEALLEAQAVGELQNRQEALIFAQRWLEQGNRSASG